MVSRIVFKECVFPSVSPAVMLSPRAISEEFRSWDDDQDYKVAVSLVPNDGFPEDARYQCFCCEQLKTPDEARSSGWLVIEIEGGDVVTQCKKCSEEDGIKAVVKSIPRKAHTRKVKGKVHPVAAGTEYILDSVNGIKV